MDLRGILSSIYHFSKLSVQSLGLIAKAKYKHRKAKSTFRETLILHGIPPEAARELAQAYPNPIDEIFNLVKTAKI